MAIRESLLGGRRLTVPSLAELRDDIVTIASHIAENRARNVGKVFDGLSADSKEKLLQYGWPGNLRELCSVIERAVVVSTGTQLRIPDPSLDDTNGSLFGEWTARPPRVQRTLAGTGRPFSTMSLA